MTSLLLAVLSASLLGSLHCAGMCGPFALYAATEDGRVRATRLTAYHLGRLMTYLVVGLVVGVAGRAVDHSGETVGISSTAAQVAGALLIALAIFKVTPRRKSEVAKPSLLGKMVARARPWVNRLPVAVRPAGIGAVTVLLPCGWLYAFAIVAAGSGGIVPAVAVMTAFWLGTTPWLSGLTVAAKPLASRPRVVNTIVAGLLAMTGLYTMTGRATADFVPLLNAAGQETSPATLDAVTAVPPPCCRHRSDSLLDDREGR